MVFGLWNKDIKKLEQKLENRLIEERGALVSIFTSARNGLIADNTITIAREIEEAKKELNENVDVKVKNEVFEKIKECKDNLKKITDEYLNELKTQTDNYFGAVLTQYQLVIDESKHTSQEFKSIVEKSSQSSQELENRIEDLKKASKTEEITKILNYKSEIDSKLGELMAFYEGKDKKYMEIAESFKKTKETIEKDYIAAYERFEKQIEELNKLITERKVRV